jgi:hypothetical protein
LEPHFITIPLSASKTCLLALSRSFSTAARFLAAKPRNSAQRGANQLTFWSAEKHAVQHPEKLRKNPSLN